MKMTVEKYGMFVYAYNDEITLAGGIRSGNSGANETRLRFVVLDNKRINELMSEGLDQVEAQKKSEVGDVDLFIKDGTDFDVNGLVSINIKNKKDFKERRKGYGTKIIQSIVATTGENLEVRDIQPGIAAKFWKSLGTAFHNGYGKEFTAPITKKSPVVHGTVSKEKVLELKKSTDNSLEI